MIIESKSYRFYKDGKINEIYFDISFKLIDKSIFLIIKSPIEAIIYSTSYVFSFKQKEFYNFSFTRSKCQLIGNEWVSFIILSNSLFYLIANHEIENIKFSVMMNYPESNFSATNIDLESLKNECKSILESASGKISFPKNIRNDIPFPTDYTKNAYNPQSKYGRRMMRRQANFKYENGSNEYRNRINNYNNILYFVIFLFVVLFFILKYLL